ncbi:SDR family NAD(P)-dependent oxidoreductase [Photobacterium sp. 2_MG-2023]|uniref:SDR family oxidoreductase n=1 Tax=Photobacterium sp. 2_MG-2023 TaxID=3062663 RepID=UPI0026E2C3ED|nr:SDR family NAD(P)-dependent oxidoreductase [Photobacterium sp. 2_MG-2023]MDO6582963.1 SDR family NAD(P)-dependent oxidoreductase [Photobacterium sp. 2_MG-2023]
MKPQKLAGKTIVISGGSSGIGLELVKRLQPDNTVIVLGRDKEKLARLEARGVVTFSLDIAEKSERNALFRWLDDHYPHFDVLINNAGWSRPHKLAARLPVQSDDEDCEDYELELRHNLEAHIGMTLHALPRLLTRPDAFIINVTTGLVYNPKAASPYYCAAKAGLHSFTQSLREQMKEHDLQVVEVLPPLVDTPFHQQGLPATIRAVTPRSVVHAIIKGVQQNRHEIRIGLSKLAYILGRIQPSLGFHLVNRK